MNSSSTNTRRSFLRQSLALFAGGAALAACEKKQAPASTTCPEPTGLSESDLQLRTTLGYVGTSAQPGKECAGCQLFTAPPAAGPCGTCSVLKGPIAAKGYCNSWTAKT